MYSLVFMNYFLNVYFLSLKGAERLLSLEQKFKDLEEQFLCSICLERKRNVAFLCGHGACAPCTQVIFIIKHYKSIKRIGSF